MKLLKGIMVGALVVTVGLMAAGDVLAGRHGGGYGYNQGSYGQGSYGQGSYNQGTYGQGGYGMGTYGYVNILDGEPLTISGTVSDLLYYGGGMQVDTGSEIVDVYGLGPYWYWANLGVDRPVVGDQIELDAYEVTYPDGSVRIVPVSVLVNGEDVLLRDTETGFPLWGGGRGGRGGFGGGRGFNGSCPYYNTLDSE